MNFFTFFVNMERIKQDITLDRLGYGIFDYQTYRRLENEEVFADKLFTDTILQRLGIPENYFEHYVLQEYHEMHELQNDIINKIYEGKDIKQDIEVYNSLITFHSNLHVQFIEYTKLLKYEIGNYEYKKLLEMYEKVINLTVCDFIVKDYSKLLLSDIEVHLIVKYAIHLLNYDAYNGLKFSNQLLKYFTNSNSLSGEKIRCYTTFVLEISKIYLEKFEYDKVIKLSSICIEILRKSENYTNLLSLIKLKINVLSIIKTNVEELEQLKTWEEVLEKLYKEYDVNPDYVKRLDYKFFTWGNYHLISDVIKQRRMMYGISQEKLADGICDVKTISRIENKHTRIHPKNAAKILAKLGLTGELHSDNIITNNMETYKLCMNTTNLMSRNEYAQVKSNMRIIEKKLDLNKKINIQYFKHKQLLLKVRCGQISDEKFIEEAKKILNLTFPIKCFDKKIDRHFTKKEIILMCNLINSFETIKCYEEMYKYIDVLDDYFEKMNFIKGHYQTHSFFYRCLENVKGNMGDFKVSNKIIYNSIKFNFKYSYFKDCIWLIFDAIWNNKENSKDENKMLKLKDKKIYMKNLKTPYILAEIFNYNFITNFIDNERNNL